MEAPEVVALRQARELTDLLANEAVRLYDAINPDIELGDWIIFCVGFWMGQACEKTLTQDQL